jgi:hypothetical protein
MKNKKRIALTKQFIYDISFSVEKGCRGLSNEPFFYKDAGEFSIFRGILASRIIR